MEKLLDGFIYFFSLLLAILMLCRFCLQGNIKFTVFIDFWCWLVRWIIRQLRADKCNMVRCEHKAVLVEQLVMIFAADKVTVPPTYRLILVYHKRFRLPRSALKLLQLLRWCHLWIVITTLAGCWRQLPSLRHLADSGSLYRWGRVRDVRGGTHHSVVLLGQLWVFLESLLLRLNLIDQEL